MENEADSSTNDWTPCELCTKETHHIDSIQTILPDYIAIQETTDRRQ